MRPYKTKDNEITSQKSKKIVCLNPINFEVISGIIHDEAIQKSTSDSNIIEKALVDKYMGPHPKSHEYIRKLYLNGIASTFRKLMQALATENILEARYEINLNELLQFISKMSADSISITLENVNLYKQFRKQCIRMLEVIKHKTMNSELDIEQRLILKEFEETIQDESNDIMMIIPIIEFISTFSDILENKSITYSMIHTIITLTQNTWMENTDTRIEARLLIRKLTENLK